MFHKVLVLESIDNCLTPVAAPYFFCSEQCMDALLAHVERLWSEVSPPDEDANENICSRCGAKLEAGH